MSRLARFWHREGARIVCDLCPRRCKVRPGQRAFCFVREGTDEGMALTTWGRSSGFCVDPIEKKPLNHFLPGTPVLSFGTAGCNLGCKFCQNWSISKAREMDALMDDASPEAIASAAVSHGCRSVAFTYNDPVIFAEYAIDVAAACRAQNLQTVAVTAGYITAEARPEFFDAIDAANVDLKAFTEGFYRSLCLGHLEPVKETLRYLVHHTNVWVEITTLVIPGENDSEKELRDLAAWVATDLGPDVPLHLSAYHPDFKLDRPKTPPETLRRARHQAMAEGLRYVYTGNVHDPEGDATLCPGCGEVVIARDWYTLLAWRVRSGRCQACDHPIPGRFEEAPGSWGRQRKPVRISER